MTRSCGFTRRAVAVLGTGLVVAAISTASGQTTSATLAGRVVDDHGQPVSDAIVQAQSETNGTVRTDITAADGTYRIDLLEPGAWSVVARGASGETSPLQRIELTLQQQLHLDLTLGVHLSENVEVSAELPVVDSGRVGRELRVAGDRSEALPIQGRSVTDLATLDSSVQNAAAGNYFGERSSPFVVNGQSGRSNSYLIDGLDNNDQTSGTNLNAFFSQNVVREFVVMTNQFAPEFGRATGGVLNVITHQGGNEIAGELFVQGTAQSWNEPGSLVENLPQGTESQSSPSGIQAGFRLGGPIRKDKAFYFLAYEHRTNNGIVPYTGVDRYGVPGGWVVSPQRSDTLFLRTDFNISNRDFLMVRLSADDRESPDLNVGGRFTSEAGFRLEERDAQLAGTWKRVVSSDLFNEVRVMVGTSRFGQDANSSRPGVDRPSGVFGGNNLNAQQRDEDRIQLIENLTWTRGPHVLKTGIDVTRSRTEIRTRFNPTGNFLYRTDQAFEPGDCGDLLISDIDRNNPDAPVYCAGDPNGRDDDGDGVVDEMGYIESYPQVYTFIFGEPEATLDDTRYALFVQDTWQAGPRWVFSYGLRYDLSTYRLPESARVDSTIPNGGAGIDRNNLAPRFGFTFTPRSNGRLVVRGGGGMFYDKLVLGFPAVAAITSGTEVGLMFPQGLTLEWNENVVEELIEDLGYDTFREIIDNELFFPEELVMRFSTGTRLDTPYTVQYNLGVEQAVGPYGVVRANVVRALGYHLPLSRDLNPVVSIRPACRDDDGNIVPDDLTCLGIPVHRDPDIGSIAAIVTEGRSWYSGFDLSWRWQSPQAWYSLSYTVSKALDMGPDPLKGGFYLPPDSDDLGAEKARSDSDRRHRVVVAGEIGLPFWGMRISAVMQFSTGVAFNVISGDDTNLDGIMSDRPAGVGRNSGAETPLEPVNDLRREAGLSDISALREPSFTQLDLRLTQPIKSNSGKPYGMLYLQVFNLLNDYNGGPVDGRVTSRNFGRPIGYAGVPRTVEFGFKFGF